VARSFVLYRIATSRGSDVLQLVLGDTSVGVLGSDRLPAYLKYVVGQRQFCWAHLTRNLLSALDLATTPAAKRFCREALALDRRLFRLWHRFRGDPGARGSPLTRAELIAKVLPIEKRNQHFFTVHEDGVEPTNNSAERALRTAVQ
jgi:transposase